MSASHDQALLEHQNERAERYYENWRRFELPRLRAAVLAGGMVPSEMVRDGIVRVSDMVNDPHEIWRRSVVGSWHRIEIEA